MIKSVQWLQNHLVDPNVIVLDASLEAKKKRVNQIAGARFFDLPGKFSDKSSPFPNTMPDEDQFQREARNLGLNNEDTIVIYDNMGIYSSPRVWYMLKMMGHQEVYVLDGGLPLWEKEAYPITVLESSTYKKGNFIAELKNGAFKSTNEIKSNIDKEARQLIDARSAGRFDGSAPEPKAELKSGSIPGSVNIPFTKVLDNGKFKSKKDLQEIFHDEKPMIFTCGSGLTACINLLAAEIADDASEKSVYDGSWTEWATTHNFLTT